jgi:hypothetical protein
VEWELDRPAINGGGGRLGAAMEGGEKVEAARVGGGALKAARWREGKRWRRCGWVAAH